MPRISNDTGSGIQNDVLKGMLRKLEEAHRKNQTVHELSDVEWDIRNLDWEKERLSWIRQMEENSIWAMGSSPHAAQNRPGLTIHEEQVDITNESLQPEDLLELMTPRSVFGLDANLLHGIQSEMSTHPGDTSKFKVVNVQSVKSTGKGSRAEGSKSSAVLAPQKGKSQARMKKMSRLELLRFVADWDKGSFGRRDMILIEFIKCYKNKENIYCSDQLFHSGGSLIFCRFVISMQMCFLRHRRVWHYFDCLTIFVRSLQGDRYSEEFLRLGGLGFICEVIRVEISGHADKLHACKFLVHLMKGRKGIAVKMFVCDNPHFLESLIDSLTMCKDKRLVTYCGLCFENLCIEATIPNVMTVTSYVMRLLPCDFNPMIQSMAFRVLQSVIRLKPSVGARCVKPILDNLKTEDMDLLVEMSNLSLVILQTKSGSDLINQLMTVAEGIQLREQFKSIFRPHMRRGRGQHTKEQAAELRKAREKHERVRQKMNKLDHYMQQAGALFVLNRMMTDKIDFVTEFTRQGIFGLSLKTLGSCPHWEVQGQGVTMVQFLHAMSIECAISYSLMLPQKMIRLILHRPAECLRYFTAPICILLRKLGRFALRLWTRWVEKVILPAQAVSEGGILPDYFIGMCKMTRKVNEIQMALQDLLENPVMESYSKTSETHPMTTDESGAPLEPTDSEIMREFLTDDEDDISYYRTGKELLFEGKHFKAFEPFLDFQTTLSEDKLDIKVDKSLPSVILSTSNKDTELGAYEQILLQDAESKETAKATTMPPDRGADGGPAAVVTATSLDSLAKNTEEATTSGTDGANTA